MAFLLLFFMKLLALKYTLTKLITASWCERVLKRIEDFRDIKILTPFFLWGGGGGEGHFYPCSDKFGHFLKGDFRGMASRS